MAILFNWIRRTAQCVTVISVGLLCFLGLGPRTGLYRTLTVLTGSMEPSIRAGSVVVVTPRALDDVAEGDVIVYQPPVEGSPTVAHRVHEVVRSGPEPVVRTKGDANDSPDPWTARLLAGPAWRVRLSVPGLGYAIRGMRGGWVRPITVLVLPAILAMLWIRQIWWRPAPEAAGAV